MPYEHEVKFYLHSLPALETRLQSLGAQCTKPRVHEVNYRYENAAGTMIPAHQVLRLRKDKKARVTYKGLGVLEEGVSVRQEVEITVSDFDTTHALLELLGYHVVFIYEKHRTTYHFGEIEVVLDETPLGNFAELEAPNGKLIKAACPQLGLDWKARIIKNYFALFQTAKEQLDLGRDMTFENFQGAMITPAILDISFADL